MWSRRSPQRSLVTSNKSFHSRNENITSLRNGILIISLRSSSNACYVYFDPHYHTHCSGNTIFPWKYYILQISFKKTDFASRPSER